MPHPFIYSLSNHHAESPGIIAGVGQGECVTHRILAALFPKFPENSDAGCSWNSVTHMGMAISSYWPCAHGNEASRSWSGQPIRALLLLNTARVCHQNHQDIKRVRRCPWLHSEQLYYRNWSYNLVFCFRKNLNNVEYMKSWAALKALTPELLS